MKHHGIERSQKLVFKDLPEVEEYANVVVIVFADVDVFAPLSASLKISMSIVTFVPTYIFSGKQIFICLIFTLKFIEIVIIFLPSFRTVFIIGFLPIAFSILPGRAIYKIFAPVSLSTCFRAFVDCRKCT